MENDVAADANQSRNTSSAAHKWRFFRAGGFDQVQLESGADLLALDQLDQKLWVALSCPARGIEFDTRTLDLIDTDGDGHIRAPEIIAAAKWAGALLKNPDLMVKGEGSLPLEAIRDDTEDGRRLLASAQHILKNLGKGEAGAITAEDTADTVRIFAQTRFNGDGIIPPGSSDDSAVQQVISGLIACLGAETDRSGQDGLSEARAAQFFEQARAFSDWHGIAGQDGAIFPLGQETEEAAAAYEAVREKITDYFTRCRLAAYDARAAEALNGSEAGYQAISGKMLSAASEDIAAFPLAQAGAVRALPLASGVNPAWAGKMAKFNAAVVKPLLGEKAALTEEEWSGIQGRFAAYQAWAGAKQDWAVEKMGLARIREILAGPFEAALNELIAKDKALEGEAAAIAEVDRLVRYCRDLGTLANNFVSFRDFYTRRAKAIFQAGTLYLDGRSCELCVQVTDAAKHAALATLSKVCLVYCDCVRGGETMQIAAAFTAGDSDQLMAGRNGVFYDRKGQDWDATISKIIEHPISIRQAFWSPYKRIGKMIGEQVQKMAVSRAKAAEEQAAASISTAGQKAESGKPVTGQAFDVAKFAGIFAAIGLALGAIGTAIATMLTGLLGLKAWQLPLALAGLLLIVSGPAMVLAWLKLRQRNLGPILDANGWAVNARARINIPFGTALTGIARLPEGAERSLVDPFAEKRRPWKTYLFLAALAVALVWMWWRGVFVA
ncbi:MAG: hypothetical protein C3F18_08830 [Nitrosomonadales bacterium]|nr:MAG: hypothetical protein C3F18_08830 [Nitrosomonadales bacterium]